MPRLIEKIMGTLDTIVQWLCVAFLAVITVAVTWQVISRYVTRDRTTTPGFVFLEIDGLSLDILHFAKTHGYIPELARWIDSGSHRLTGWETDLSSQTGASQGGSPAARPSPVCTAMREDAAPTLLPVTIPARKPSGGMAKGASGPSDSAMAPARAVATPDPAIQRPRRT